MQKEQSRCGRALGCIFLGVLLAAAGCTAEGDSPNGGSTGPVAPSSAGTGVTIAGTGGGGWQPQAGTAGYGQWYQPDPEADAGLDGGGACQAVTAVGENVVTEVLVEVVKPKPIAIYIMLDATMSMTGVSLVDLTSLGVDKWTPAVDAINTFVNDPKSAGIDVALETFPVDPADPQSAAATTDCSGIGYNDPAVPMGPLPDNAPAISNHIGGVTPAGMGTPTEGAVNGATQYCANFMQDTTNNPDGEKCVVVLVTDGTPENFAIQCPNLDINFISDIAGTAYNDSGVRTFAIGMQGANFDFLNMVGQKSNADCTPADGEATWACDVSQTGGTGLLEALNSIRDTVTEFETVEQLEQKIVDCEWTIPEPPSGQLFNRDKVNFQFTTGVDQPVERLIKRVDSADECQPGVEAWYYDNLDEPTKILVCDDTCEMIRAEEQARIDILLGCDTIKID
jgi:uncharacterized protein YegL